MLKLNIYLVDKWKLLMHENPGHPKHRLFMFIIAQQLLMSWLSLQIYKLKWLTWFNYTQNYYIMLIFLNVEMLTRTPRSGASSTCSYCIVSWKASVKLWLTIHCVFELFLRLLRWNQMKGHWFQSQHKLGRLHCETVQRATSVPLSEAFKVPVALHWISIRLHETCSRFISVRIVSRALL